MRCWKMRCWIIRRCWKHKHIPVEWIEISESEIGIEDTFQLRARVLPHNASNQKILWSSSDETIATVEDWLVTPWDQWRCVVTATSEEWWYTATCQVVVHYPY